MDTSYANMSILGTSYASVSFFLKLTLIYIVMYIQFLDMIHVSYLLRTLKDFLDQFPRIVDKPNLGKKDQFIPIWDFLIDTILSF